MTTHELARVLLAAPDEPALVYLDQGFGPQFTPVQAIIPGVDDVEYMGLNKERVGRALICERA